ncbi:GLUCAN SYNTHASE-LIKE 8 family protein [Rhynchospora pubera]|uniref:1,3-beta-glucan synthase n=1 Tax=Rhynchospora pubera TaxID=906938 RepID=A0AAV8E9Q9_9POAL|nr:GLUCAN SYNTHASE-LIKE 8 family protein [Rhynchospora pubera]
MAKRIRALDNWERLVRAILQREHLLSSAATGTGTAPASLGGKAADIDRILQAANEIEDEDPNVTRILCESAYIMAHAMDPNSKGRGVMQFKTALMSVIKTKPKEGVSHDQEHDIQYLWNFYSRYKRHKRVSEMEYEQQEWIESGTFIGFFPEVSFSPLLPWPAVRAAVAAIGYTPDIPRLPSSFEAPEMRKLDIFDFLQFIFGFQVDNVRNQRENVILTISNAQARINLPSGTDPKIEDAAVTEVFCKVLDNYMKWCAHLGLRIAWKSTNELNKTRKIILISLYLLIWGEASNVRFLPECICYIFHNMAEELEAVINLQEAVPATSCKCEDGSVSYLKSIISPIYDTLKEEADKNIGGRASHAAWRNYDDFNEYFWSPWRVKHLGWPPKANSSFLLKPRKGKRMGKTNFVEHRTFLHLYRSFHRLWIFLILMFQLLTIIAFHNGTLDTKTFKVMLSAGPAFFILNLIECCLDVLLMFGAYKSARGFAISRQVARFIWFGVLSAFVFYLYWKVMDEANNSNSESTYYHIYILVLGVYAAVKLAFALIVKIPACHKFSEISDRYTFFQFFKWIYEERYFVGRAMYESLTDYLRYVVIWVAILACKFTFAYFLQIKPLVNPTKVIVRLSNLPYSWHDLVSGGNHNALTLVSLWAPVFAIYIMDLHIWYTLCSALVGGIMGAAARIGEIRSIDMLQRRFQSFPEAFSNNLVSQTTKRIFASRQVSQDPVDMEKQHATTFSPFWNEIVKSLREEDYISNMERDLLMMPSNCGSLKMVQWPLFLLTSKILLAIEFAVDCEDSQADLWSRISSDNYMAYAVQECYYSAEIILSSLVEAEGRLCEEFDTWHILAKARNEGRLFQRINWPREPEMQELIKRLHLLLTKKESAANIPKNLEARRRLQFFTNSLFMDMPIAKSVSEMMPFSQSDSLFKLSLDSVFTPYYEETVLFSASEIQDKNEDGISILFYLQKIFPVRGMMYYRRALLLQSYLERRSLGGVEEAYSIGDLVNTLGFELNVEARAQAELKFTYVVSCQIYGTQRQNKASQAIDIALLLQRNEGLRVAFIHEETAILPDGTVSKEYYSKLVKANIHGKYQEIFSIKLPGNPKLGEGKPENQNHAIIFTRGEAIQTIDMNQDNYLEEAMKMRNLLEEFHVKHGLRYPTILGVREHIFTGSVSSLASFMSNQETSFVTLGQRVLAFLKVRMHYGHPDVFDRIFHITRGGISKASRVINISEDIYSGFNSTLRQGNITHHEYIQVGKGRDVGLNQIAIFEGKVAGGNGEQVLSRDVYRLGQLFDFFRMLTFYFTTVGFYVCTMVTVLTVYIFLYGRVYLALSGLDSAISKSRIAIRFLGNKSLDATLNAQFLVQIGVFTAVPMIMGFILELGLIKAVLSFVTMQLQLCSVFFTFSLGTRTHYFGRIILHGGAKYGKTGRGFVVQHIKFAENYRLYSRSHFVKAFEVAMLLIVYIAYGYTKGGATSFILITISSWFLVFSWLFAPYIFNPCGFEWQKIVEDFDDWIGWLMYKGGIGAKGDKSWEVWWEEEQAHIQTLRGRILETILSLRFLIFQYGIVYKLHVGGHNTSLGIYIFSWIALVIAAAIFKAFTISPKKHGKLPVIWRFLQMVIAISLVVGLILFVMLTTLTTPDLFAISLAFIATGWTMLSLAITWKRFVKLIGAWGSIREIARMYDAGMGLLIFVPVALLSWFPFISAFQSRFLFNQAFSRGLEISLILAGNKANVQS